MKNFYFYFLSMCAKLQRLKMFIKDDAMNMMQYNDNAFEIFEIYTRLITLKYETKCYVACFQHNPGECKKSVS